MNFKKALALSALIGLLPLSLSHGQTPTDLPKMPSQEELTAHMKYLASDELMGRMTGEEGNNLAAKYIADHFAKYGLIDPTDGGYFQKFNLIRTAAPTVGFMVVDGDSLIERANLVTTNGAGLDGEYDLVFVGSGAPDASGNPGYSEAQVKGKIVVAMFGDGESADLRTMMPLSQRKRTAALERGAAGLIEVFDNPDYPFANLIPQVTRSRMLIDDGNAPAREFPHWYADGGAKERLGKDGKAKVSSSGFAYQMLPTQNVVGILEGSDPQLKNEYVLLMAHYDHVGAGMRPGISAADTIFNGARDNAAGTVAVMAAAQALSETRPARSTIFLAVTAEEIGLIGSRYYVQHPLVPLNQTVYVSNIDNAGYNDTTIVTVVGMGRTTADADIIAGTAAAGLKAVSDPSPEQNLFDRSDNVNFAAQGIPAPTYSLGFTAFDEEINKYYHKPADHADENFDFAYYTKYVRGYIETTIRIANNPERPRWLPGDKYEEAFNSLFGGK